MSNKQFNETIFHHVERRNTASKKWDNLIGYFGSDQVIPMSIADMDYNTDENIINRMKARAGHGIYGYVHQTDEFFDAIINWQKKNNNWEIKKEWITTSPGVVAAQAVAVLALTEEGDEIILQTPAYPPFFYVINGNRRKVIENPLVCRDGRYHMNLEDLERKITAKTKLIFLCSPHNPTGRCWSVDELTKVGEIALKHHLIIVSDEIFGDLVFDGRKHAPIASLNDLFAEITVTSSSPSKTFNLAGLSTSYTIIQNKELRQKFKEKIENIGIDEINSFGLEALITAYTEGSEWKDQVIAYLEGNRDLLEAFIKERIPRIRMIHPEGTYMAWLDCRNISTEPTELQRFFVEEVQIGLKNGAGFGSVGNGFMRLSFACNRQFLISALEKIERAVNHFFADDSEIRI